MCVRVFVFVHFGVEIIITVGPENLFHPSIQFNATMDGTAGHQPCEKNIKQWYVVWFCGMVCYGVPSRPE